jgi:hypothetical protein
MPDMLQTMPPPKKSADRGKPSYVDVFSRMDGETVKKLDELADDQHRSRSGMVAWLVEQFIAAEYPKLQDKRRGQK